MNSETPIYLGVDGGGTKTALCLITADGQLVAQTRARSIYYLRAGIGLVSDVLGPAVGKLCAHAGVEADEVAYAFFGLPGYGESTADRAVLDEVPRRFLGHDRYRCDNDMVAGWAGSLGAVDGVNVISGTGSMTYGERRDRRVRVGGWGEVFGDEGSAYWIAVRGLNAYARMADGRLAPGPLLAILREHLGLTADLDLVDVVFNRMGARRSEVAELCPQVVRAADAGDDVAAAILDDAARELALLVSVTLDRLGFPADERVRVSWSGGTFRARRVLEGFRRALLTRHPQVDLHEPLLPPVVGAAAYAARLDGHLLDDAAVQRLATTVRGRGWS